MTSYGKVTTVDADAVFRVFTACPTGIRTLIIDVRDKKKWDKGHIAGSYCIRKPGSGDTLLDYSKAEYDLKWSADVWWNKDVIVYGDASLKKDHPVVAFLSADKHARSIGLYREGLEAFQRQYPFLVTSSLRSAAAKLRYPSQLDRLLYLGDWSHAEDVERHAELGIRAVVTIHNNPENLRLPAGKYSHLKIELADIDTADIGAHLLPAFDFIEEAMAAKRAVLVHCGAGVSRSATLCIAWLMRKHRWSAQKALDFAKRRRSLVAPNDGFWRTLCALEAQLGIAERSNADAFAGFHGADAAALPVLEEPKVRVTFIPAGATSAPAGSMATTAPPPQLQPAAAQGREGRRERSRSRERRRSRSRERERRRRSRSRSRSRDRDGQRRRRGSRSRSRERRRSRSRSRDRRGGGASATAAAATQRSGEEHVDLESTAGAVLEVLREGKSLGHLVVELTRPSQECVFGRLPSCGVPLEHLSISRAHARLTADASGALSLTDMGSAHGTNLDGVWIKPRVPKQLRPGSTFKLGASAREYRVVRPPSAMKK